ncbi:MAG: iduronate-2-sulfatase, partial [Planctomycetota bacterium]
IPEALHQIELLAADERPFLLAVGILRPHLPFGAPARYLLPYAQRPIPPIPHPQKPTWRSTWHGSGEFMKYNRWGKNPNVDTQFADEVRRHYAACVSFADAQVGKLLARLDTLGLADDTIVVLWGDHGWHLGERAVWGKHTLFEESLRSPLLVRYPEIKRPGEHTSAIVESVDIFPTLCELADLPVPPDLNGQSLTTVLDHPDSSGGFAISYFKQAHTVRTDRFRMVEHRDGYVELYDHRHAGEDKNIAEEHPDVVQVLRDLLMRYHGAAR